MSAKISNLLISQLEKDPHIKGSKLTLEQLENIIKQARNAYYNTDKPIFTDNTYDILENILKQLDPTNELFEKVGAPVNQNDKVRLPFYLGSLDKIKPGEKSLTKWLKDHSKNIIISEKLDGLSSLLTISLDSGNMKLYKHGDGYEGQDITHLLKNINFNNSTISVQPIKKQVNNIVINSDILNTIQKQINKYKTDILALRGEIIIKNEIFNSKYSKLYPKARSLIAGIVNSKTPEESIVSDMEIVFYEVISPENIIFEKQFEFLNVMGFNVAKYKIFPNLDESQLPDIYMNFKKDSNYEIDGIVLGDNSQIWERVKKDNPEYAVAFKMPLEEQIANTKIINVEYNISKHGTLAPRIEYNPVMIKGDLHRYTTGFNLKYIVDNKINIGTEIQIIKSGDVIPYIYKILKSSNEPLMPDKNLKWHWTDSGVDAVLDNAAEHNDVIMQKIVAFFTTLKISGVAEGVIRKFINAGYNNLLDILQLTPDIIANIEGFQKKSADNVYNAIHKILDKPQKLERVMMASGVFEIGLGEKKFKMVLDAIPHFYKKYIENKITPNDILNINGFSNKTTDILLSGMPKFIEWLENHSMIKIDFDDINKKDQKELSNANKDDIRFKGMNIVFTGIRDDNMENIIIAGGGIISSTISSKTTLIIAKDPNENSSKLKKARDMRLEICSYQDFSDKYKINIL